ncbi:MAG: N-acetyltransferase family protein [Clostridiales bacterium]|nr:N-acetyltransferase family protein [Clostridiales bacterium]
MIRLVRPSDAPALLAIYAQSIHTPVTFEYELPTLEEFRGRIRDISACYPYLVLEEDGAILGYAYAHRLRERAAFAWDAELSVYLDRSAQGRGLGTELYTVLLELLRRQGVQAVYGCITSPNPASVALHEKLGFRYCGAFHRTGYKDGHWWDVLWYEKQIGAGQTPPPPLKNASEIAGFLTEVTNEQKNRENR